MSYQSLKGLRHPSPTHHPSPNQHFPTRERRKNGQKRSTYWHTQKLKQLTYISLFLSIYLLQKLKLMTKHRRGCYQNSSEVAKRVTWEQPQLLALHNKSLPFLKHFLLSLSTFSSTLKKRLYPTIIHLLNNYYMFNIFISLCWVRHWMDENTHLYIKWNQLQSSKRKVGDSTRNLIQRWIPLNSYKLYLYFWIINCL